MSQMHPPNATVRPSKSFGKDIPPLFWQCDTGDLVVLISDMIMQLIEHNDKLPLTPSGLTRFHSRAPPGISVHDYLNRIVRYTSLEKTSLLSTVIYIDRLCSAFPAFVVSSLTIHRFLITATTVASKGLCDAFCTNSHYAKVGGITLGELNVLELEMLARTDWRILCSVDQLQSFYVNMAANNPKYQRLRLESEVLMENSKSQQGNMSRQDLIMSGEVDTSSDSTSLVGAEHVEQAESSSLPTQP